MAWILYRSKLKLLSHQFKRCYVQTPYASFLNYTTKSSKSCPSEYPIWDICKKSICRRPTDFCNNVRFFAAPVQVKAKKEEDAGGPRLNDNIKAQFVRLVTDEGHDVVSLREALELAEKLKLDLVEVDRNADPPVCKIMDFHKEQYKRHVVEKDRAKSKSELTLRKGDCKEVRFSEKTEQKDLKMKADSVLRLIQRGYRVKCMVLRSSKKGSGRKDSDDEDLTEEEIAERKRQEEKEEEESKALLSRLTALIQDEFVVESGPRVEKRQAFVIIRHAKFGPLKKGSAKKLDAEKVTISQPTANHSSMHCREEMYRPSQADSPKMNFNSPHVSHPRPVDDSKQADRLPSSSQPSLETENRYRRSEPRERFPPPSSGDSRGPDKTESFRFGSQFSHPYGHTESEITVAPSVREGKPIQIDSFAFGNRKLPRAEMLKQDPNRPDDTSTQSSNYGIFSSPNAATPRKQGVTAEFNNNREGIPYNSSKNPNTGGFAADPRFSTSKPNGDRRPGDDGSRQGRWGRFSRDGSNINPNRISKYQ
ncbi:hypothetical protein P3X46_028133 [Hevea brasiliensis]|uniref:Translation initiation factor 3 N-terminal domain-containing protein n=1 Tax=Hevea brasiliensis TaxID=3981 RepID=A0ABQ9KPA5_HEVBR|nr:translation initiation factor IF3-1, mitochondrial [Hevea brasiliensis]KAJ9145797.1 hypothetical protein P3X46_028133 [Hevea brasiliensis]